MQDGTNVKKGDRGLMIEFSTCFSEGEKCPTLTRYPPVGTNSYVLPAGTFESMTFLFPRWDMDAFFCRVFHISSKDMSHTQYPSPDSMLVYPRAYHLSLALMEAAGSIINSEQTSYIMYVFKKVTC